MGHTWRLTGLIPVSELRSYAWQAQRTDYMGCQRSNLDQLHAGQSPIHYAIAPALSFIYLTVAHPVVYTETPYPAPGIDLTQGTEIWGAKLVVVCKTSLLPPPCELFLFFVVIVGANS